MPVVVFLLLLGLLLVFSAGSPLAPYLYPLLGRQGRALGQRGGLLDESQPSLYVARAEFSHDFICKIF